MTIKIIPKATIRQLSANVNAQEVKCQCDYAECWYTLYSPELLERFELLRFDCGNVPISIMSGFRCYKHNNFIGGVLKSKHKIALALDLAIPKGFNIGDFGKRCWQHFDIVIPYKNEKFIHCANFPWEEI